VLILKKKKKKKKKDENKIETTETLFLKPEWASEPKDILNPCDNDKQSAVRLFS
jgi:hypothetical protein